MKRFLGISLCAALAACSSPEDMSDSIGVAEVAGDESAETAQATLDRRLAVEAKAFAFSETEGDEKKGMREFSYAWPRQVTAIPALNAAFEDDFAKAQAAQKTEWASALKDCPGDFVSCRNNSLSLEWQVVADTPRFLSLSTSVSTYTGGAHGNYGRGSTVWDRETEQQLETLQMFQSPAALEKTLGATACEELNRERGKRRGQPVVEDPSDWSSTCVPMEDAVLFLGSTNGKTFDRIGVYYGPYVAGPYAEGDFEFTLPVTDRVLDAVNPEHRDAFSVVRETNP